MEVPRFERSRELGEVRTGILCPRAGEDVDPGSSWARTAVSRPAWPDRVTEGAVRAGPGVELFATVEQDMYPCEPGKPLPIAVRTRRFLRSCGA
ncbi:hypothetical protein [Streptomyces blattellae]|uniref:hypothetical protein n=1 Tax=Streptomyces blattellae TaxID=2569855 RepID=UPI0038B515AE